MELGEDDPTGDAVDVELEDVYPPDSAFFSTPHGDETDEDGAVDEDRGSAPEPEPEAQRLGPGSDPGFKLFT